MCQWRRNRRWNCTYSVWNISDRASCIVWPLDNIRMIDYFYSIVNVEWDFHEHYIVMNSRAIKLVYQVESWWLFVENKFLVEKECIRTEISIETNWTLTLIRLYTVGFTKRKCKDNALAFLSTSLHSLMKNLTDNLYLP